MVTIKAWAGVHHTRLASMVLVVTAVVSLLAARTALTRIGGIVLHFPVAVLLLPAIAGVGAAIACSTAAAMSLPDPPRALVARATWAALWVLAAIAATSVGLIVGPAVTWEPVARNVLVHCSLALLLVTARQEHLLWLPPLLLTYSSMMFGIPDDPERIEPYWWALILAEQVDGKTWATVVGLSLFTLVLYVTVPHLRQRRR